MVDKIGGRQRRQYRLMKNFARSDIGKWKTLSEKGTSLCLNFLSCAGEKTDMPLATTLQK